MENEREVQVFDSVGSALEEAEYCANSENRLYAIIQWGGYFGVLPKANMVKEDVLYETIIPESAYQQATSLWPFWLEPAYLFSVLGQIYTASFILNVQVKPFNLGTIIFAVYTLKPIPVFCIVNVPLNKLTGMWASVGHYKAWPVANTGVLSAAPMQQLVSL